MSTPLPRACRRAFTLVELLVAMTVLVVLVGVTAQLTNGVSSIINRGGAHLDADGQARRLLDRMALDFEAMVKRPDVDYYLKGRPTSLRQPGNDQIAFYSEVRGYFAPSTGAAVQSPASLIAYRINPDTLCMERLCKGLTWNGAAAGKSIAFLPVPLASPLPEPLPSPFPASPPAPLWPQAADPRAQDLDYEVVGAQVFRFEYYYVLKGQAPPDDRTTVGIVPWYDAAPVSHVSVNGMRDVAGVGVVLAVLDQKNRRLVSKEQLATLAGQMEDAPDPAGGDTVSRSPRDTEKRWLDAANNGTLPRQVSAAVRIYSRCFYLNGVQP